MCLKLVKVAFVRGLQCSLVVSKPLRVCFLALPSIQTLGTHKAQRGFSNSTMLRMTALCVL